jgi:hypothetical protein
VLDDVDAAGTFGAHGASLEDPQLRAGGGVDEGATASDSSHRIAANVCICKS